MNDFDRFAQQMRASLTAALAWGDGKLYTSNAADLDQVYLSGFSDPVARQYHNCSACRSFLRRYGGLLVTNGTEMRSALWSFTMLDASPHHFRKSHGLLRQVVDSARITGVFASSLTTLGIPEAGGWTHFSVPNPVVHDRRVHTAGQYMAQFRQDFITLRRGLDEFTEDVFASVHALLASNVAQRSSKFEKTAEKYLALKRAVATAAGQNHRDMILIHALANAGPGFAGIKSSALGTLYEDLQKGMPAPDAIKRFNAVTNPYVYQQPTAAPKAGNVKRAEEIFEALGLEPALHRREALFNEVRERCAWVAGMAVPASIPAPAAPRRVFHALHQGADTSAHQVNSKSSLRRFMEGVIRGIDSMQIVQLDRGHSLGTITSAVYHDAPTLFAWHGPYSWYRWFSVKGAEFGLSSAAEVLGVLDLPGTWFDAGGPHRGLMFVLKDARDKNSVGSGICAEGLRADLHEVKRTIVAHSLNGTMLRAGPNEQAAAGLIIRQDDFKPFVIRTFKGSVATDWAITSWE